MDIQEVSLVRFKPNEFSTVHALLPYRELACSMEIPSGAMLHINIDDLRLGALCINCLNGLERIFKNRGEDYVSDFFSRNTRQQQVDALEELLFLKRQLIEKHSAAYDKASLTFELWMSLRKEGVFWAEEVERTYVDQWSYARGLYDCILLVQDAIVDVLARKNATHGGV